jgi:hypothetical protein
MRDNTVILQGSRDSSTGLWQICLQPSTLPPTIPLVPQLDNQPTANNVHELTVKQDIVTYLHRACFTRFHPLGSRPLMPATSQHGLASQSISFANTLPNLSPPPKAICARSATPTIYTNFVTSPPSLERSKHNHQRDSRNRRTARQRHLQ